MPKLSRRIIDVEAPFYIESCKEIIANCSKNPTAISEEWKIHFVWEKLDEMRLQVLFWEIRIRKENAGFNSWI